MVCEKAEIQQKYCVGPHRLGKCYTRHLGKRTGGSQNHQVCDTPSSCSSFSSLLFFSLFSRSPFLSFSSSHFLFFYFLDISTSGRYTSSLEYIHMLVANEFRFQSQAQNGSCSVLNKP